MENQHHELLSLLINQGIPLTETVLCANIWFHFGNQGEELPYFYFHPDGQGLFKTPDSETEIFWEMSEGGNILIEITDHDLLLFNSDGLKEQWQAFSN